MTPLRPCDPGRLACKLRAVVLALWSLLLLVLGVPGLLAAAEPIQCDKKEAEMAFSSGFDRYSRRKWAEAMPGLKEATRLCPQPSDPWIITVPGGLGLGETPYIPFFYLGRCQYELKDPLDALRQFHLSSCTGEPARDRGKTKEPGKDLDSMTGTCLKSIKELHRYPRSLFFGEGYTAKENKKWEEAAERMWDSMQVWPQEDGETTVTAGRWIGPYVPRFHLANALYELGCQKEACEQLARSKIKELAAKDNSSKYDKEREEMKRLEAKCAGPRSGGPENMWTCQQWQCWLQRDRRQAP